MTASPWCQRWSGRRHSWRHRSEGGFDPDGYQVTAIDEPAAKGFVLEHHYSASYPAASWRFGLHHGDDLVGVAVLSVPTSSGVLTNVFPDLVPYREALELGRFVLRDEVPANAESWFLARAFRLAWDAGVRGVVAFSDPMPRRTPAGLLFPGHVGTIYQASNARYCGRATARTLTLLPDGTVLNARAMSKVRQMERGHEHVERRLVALGAREPSKVEDRRTWLAEALVAAGARSERHSGNHRYAFGLGGQRRAGQLIDRWTRSRHEEPETHTDRKPVL